MQANAEQPPSPRKRKHIEHSDELRHTIVQLRGRGDSWAQIEAVTRVPAATARAIMRIFNAEGVK